MSSKVKQSIAVQRQIPEHIRDNYPMFVEFVKMYYDYLEQTQQQDLESMRDVDTVLDEFIDRFKTELSRNFPLELASDKRLILKHLREFYLSRGSEASYEFLFRTLFAKEASLFYPSTQILRVSDGRWKQDVSIFVVIEGIDANTDITIVNDLINSSIGKYAVITNSSGKAIRTVVEQMIQYNNTTFEVFIDRDYINEINVGADVKLSGVSYAATIIPCPAVLKIYKGGKGFKAGDIFALKTQIGRGCIIKVVKVDTQGAIQKIQVIKFGLDYKTKFYSYLSSKDQNAYEYIHPLKIGAGESDTMTATVVTAGSHTYNVNYVFESGTPLVLVEVIRAGALVQPTPSYIATTGTSVTVNDLQSGDQVVLTGILVKGTVPGVASPAYTERSGGFIDYGWATKQTYFQYDATIPVADPAWASDRFFADPAYVGDAVQQFYTDTTEKVIDEDLAIIEIDLGATAKYPGYYMTSDGFISDQIYIQDGDYYQAFSYVIRVEEELRRYADIVKALVHPAGMKVFSEYNIFNELKLLPIQPRSVVSLQLPLFDHAPSSVYADDRGYEWSSYDATFENGVVTTIPSVDAQKVYARQGKAAWHDIKNLFESLNVSTETYPKGYSKDIQEYVNNLSVQYKFLTKDVRDVISEYIETRVLDYTKNHVDAVTEPDSQQRFYDSVKLDIQLIIDSSANILSKPVNDVITAVTDIYYTTFFKNLVETVIYVDPQVKDYEKPLVDTFTAISAPSKDPGKNVYDDLLAPSDVYITEFVKNLYEVLDQIETQSRDYLKPLTDSFIVPDVYISETSKPVNDVMALIADTFVQAYGKDLVETLVALDVHSGEYTQNLTEIITLIDTYTVTELLKTLNENQSLLEVMVKTIDKSQLVEDIILTEVIAISLVRELIKIDIIDAVTDLYINEAVKNFYESVSFTDYVVNGQFKDFAESINIGTNGRVTLAPYDSEYYFALFSDYQPATIIT